MPPRRVIDSDEESTEEEDELDTTTDLNDDRSVESGMQNAQSMQGRGGGVTTNTAVLENAPNDERYNVDDAQPIRTPPDDGSVAGLVGAKSEGDPQQSQALYQPHTHRPSPGLEEDLGLHKLINNPNDEVIRVEDDERNIPTPRNDSQSVPDRPTVVLRNAPHDEAIPVPPHGVSVGTPRNQPSKEMGAMSPSQDESSGDDEAEEVESSSRGYTNQRPEAIDTESEIKPIAIPSREYKPQDYAKINATASQEMQELFKHILDYQPIIPEYPAKLRPFIPDYVPSIGDLDPFCKITRPDGRPDGLGLYVLDEPSVSQSNPAVVLLELRATNIHSSGGLAEVVDSFEDAANRPEVIDRWIADVKKVHYKKPLPTTNYQKPMPEIEYLLQVWPTEFEEVLNTDIQLPPPHIDLDLDQYVRTLCCILDIPTYNSLIDSLHVMFTLYQEFRANQHFQHE